MGRSRDQFPGLQILDKYRRTVFTDNTLLIFRNNCKFQDKIQKQNPSQKIIGLFRG